MRTLHFRARASLFAGDRIGILVRMPVGPLRESPWAPVRRALIWVFVVLAIIAASFVLLSGFEASELIGGGAATVECGSLFLPASDDPQCVAADREELPSVIIGTVVAIAFVAGTWLVIRLRPAPPRTFTDT